MINKDKIVFQTKTYFTPSYCSVTGIRILKQFPDGLLLVKASRGNPFVRQIKDVYNEAIHAKHGGKEWEHDERKRKKSKHKRKNKNSSKTEGK